MKAKPDETLEEIWAIRRQIAKKFGGDPRKQVAYYQLKQKERGMRIYRPEVPAAADVLHDRPSIETVAGQRATLTSYRAKVKRKAKRSK